MGMKLGLKLVTQDFNNAIHYGVYSINDAIHYAVYSINDAVHHAVYSINHGCRLTSADCVIH